MCGVLAWMIYFILRLLWQLHLLNKEHFCYSMFVSHVRMFKCSRYMYWNFVSVILPSNIFRCLSRAAACSRQLPSVECFSSKGFPEMKTSKSDPTKSESISLLQRDKSPTNENEFVQTRKISLKHHFLWTLKVGRTSTCAHVVTSLTNFWNSFQSLIRLCEM